MVVEWFAVCFFLLSSSSFISLFAAPLRDEEVIQATKANKTYANKTLLWVPNRSGLFSQFFQLRQMVRYAHRYKRRLVIGNFSSSHFTSHNETNSLCDVFDLPSTIGCDKERLSPEDRNRTLSSCLTSFSAKAFRANNMTKLCYKGYLFGSRGLLSDHKRLQLVSGEPKIRFRGRYLQLFDEHVQPRLKALTRGAPYTVAHWRRGDQLTTRCKRHWVGLKDTSSNCRSAAEFIADVRGSLGGGNRETVLVATNEGNESSLSVLRRAEGFYILSELLQTPPRRPLSEIDEFVLEALVMLRAPSLLTCGISTINDLVESARKEQGRSYCLKAADDQDLNWCTLNKETRG